MSIIPGQYTGHLVDYGFGETSEKKPQVIILFEWNDPSGETHQWMWQGSLNPGKATNITMSVLKIFGFDKTKHQLIDIADGVSTGILDTQKQVNLTVTEEEYKGRMYTKISRVSLPGTLIDQRRLTKAHAEELLQKIEAAYGSQPTAASAGAAAASDTSTSNEVPF